MQALAAPLGARRLSENGYFPQFLRQSQILILKILQCILAVKIFAFLDLAKILSFSDKLLWPHRRVSGFAVCRHLTLDLASDGETLSRMNQMI